VVQVCRRICIEERSLRYGTCPALAEAAHRRSQAGAGCVNFAVDVSGGRVRNGAGWVPATMEAAPSRVRCSAQ
jgi:hypothetical protein